MPSFLSPQGPRAARHVQCMRALTLLVLLAGLWLKPSLSEADSFRCGPYLVKTGDTFVEVLETCGPPLAKTGAVERLRSGSRDLYIGVEQWIYDTGKYRLRRILVFRNGFLDEVLVGSRQR
jgi:hypothetical protein